MSEEEEYEVENVVEAKLQTSSTRGRGGKGKTKQKLGWQYNVKWKGYDADENTWEPAESFDESGEMLVRFWERVDTGGRDIKNLELFKPNEVFRPSGPPRRVKRQKISQSIRSEIASKAPPQSEEEPPKSAKFGKKRQASPMDTEEEEPVVKRKRGRPSAQKAESSASAVELRRTSRSRAGEQDSISARRPITYGRKKSSSGRRKNKPSSSDDEIILASPSVESAELPPPPPPAEVSTGPDNSEPTLFENDSNDPLSDTPKKASLPSHRARVAKPLIKMADDSGVDFENGISTKTRLLSQSTNSEGASSSTPVRRVQKSRPSVLTATKTGLRIVKGKYTPPDADDGEHNSPRGPLLSTKDLDGVGDDTMEVDAVLALDTSPVKVPTTQELLETAGLNQADAAALPDFEEDATVTEATEVTIRNSNVSRAAENLFPTPAQPSSSLLSNAKAFVRNTIFHPLTTGLNVPSTSDTPPGPILPAFSLSLDSSVTISIYIRDLFHKTGTRSLDTVIAANPKGPPGKFYRDPIASSLVSTLGPGGSSARIEVNENVDDNQKAHFERFRARLEAGELFVCLSGQEVLAFWSSSNAAFGKKLGAPENLIGLATIVIVSLVIIEDLSNYADLACKAEHVRW